MRTLLLTAITVAFAGSSALAGFTVTTPPASPAVLSTAVAEGSGSIASSIVVDVVPPTGPGTINAGTFVESYAFSVTNPTFVPSQAPGAVYNLQIMFTQPILGVVYLGQHLSDSYDVLDGSAGFAPVTLAGRLNPQELPIQFFSAGNYLSLRINTGLIGAGADSFRVLTATPEIASLGTWALAGIVGTVWSRRRR